jgi:hypothetical protein
MLAHSQLIESRFGISGRRAPLRAPSHKAARQHARNARASAWHLHESPASTPLHAARRSDMSAITISDLHYDRELDHQAMASIGGGGGAPWIYGWITPFIGSLPGSAGGGNVVNVFDITNNIYDITNNINNFNAVQMTNQIQAVNVTNSGANANLTVTPVAVAGNRAG